MDVHFFFVWNGVGSGGGAGAGGAVGGAQKAPLKCRFCDANCGMPWLRAKTLLITFNSSRFLKLLNGLN